MDDFYLIKLPDQHQLTIDSNPRNMIAEGFNYPTLKLLNKQFRVSVSPKPLNLTGNMAYNLFAAANKAGWFAALRNGVTQEIVLSPLAELRTELVNASSDTILDPKRIVSSSGKACILAFGMNDTRLFVGFEEGRVEVFDTNALFSPGSQGIAPLAIFHSPGLVKQILPNPGAEPGLAELCAIIHSDSKVQLFNGRLESQGGWTAASPELSPVSISWSPKGKQLAIGVSSGDILTYALNSKDVCHKHIPSTATSPLVSVKWLLPGHTFQATYAPLEERGDSSSHIIHLDTKASAVFFYDARTPYPLPDRCTHPYSVILPHWDTQPGTNDEPKCLVIYGDSSSTDFEILGGVNTTWSQQMLDNPISLPLDKNLDDTILLALDADLTDRDMGVPIIYAYLNDGTVLGWQAEHPFPYIGNYTLGTIAGTIQGGNNKMGDDKVEFTPFELSSDVKPNVFGQPPSSSAFGKPPMLGAASQTQSGSAFGQPSAFRSEFNLPNSPGAFGQGFGSAALTLNTPVNTSSIIREASMSDDVPPYGGLSLDNASSSEIKSKFGGGIFGDFATPTTMQSLFSHGSNATPTAFGAFASFGSASTSPSIQPSLAQSQPNSIPVQSPFGQPKFGQSGFGGPTFSQPTFGQSSFGQSTFVQPTFGANNGVTSGAPTFDSLTPSSLSNFGSSMSPSAGGFGAFATVLSKCGEAVPRFQTFHNSPETTADDMGTNMDQQETSTSPTKPSSRPLGLLDSQSSSDMKTAALAPASPISKSTTPFIAAGANAFGIPKASSSIFKPATGFGAFGGGDEGSSPFFKKPDEILSVNAFSSLTSTTPAAKISTHSTTPAFGTPFQVGAANLIFGVSGFGSFTTPTKSNTMPSTTPSKSLPATTGAFGAFAGSAMGFSTFPASNKSFGDLLKSVDGEKPIEKRESVTVFSYPAPIQTSTTPPAEVGTTLEIAARETQPKRDEGDKKSASESEEEEGEEDEEDGELGVEEGETEEENSEDFDSEPETDDGDLEEVFVPQESPEPLQNGSDFLSRLTLIPQVLVSSPVVNPSVNGPLPAIREESTTPPASPEKLERSKSAAPASPISPSTAPTSLSLGRPNTKPARSSPLVNVMNNEDKGVREEKSSQQAEGKPEKSVELKGLFATPKSNTTSPVVPPTIFTGSSSLPRLCASTSADSAGSSTTGVQNKQEAAEALATLAGGSPLLDTQLPTALLASKHELASRFASSFPTPVPAPIPQKPSIFGVPSLTAPRFPSPALQLPAKPFAGFGGVFSQGPRGQFDAKPQFPAPVNTFGAPQLATGFPPFAPIVAESPTRTLVPSTPTHTISVASTAPQKPAHPELLFEDGMQKECTMLVAAMFRELENFRNLAQNSAQKLSELNETKGLRDKVDLGDPNKWGHADFKQSGRLLGEYEKDLVELKAIYQELKGVLREIQSNLLKASTRKEEISRFAKAKSDQEFGRMLKSRTLGPEHLEAQMQLRRSVRIIWDRIEKLEDHLQAFKKRINESKSGRPSIKAPSLDIINRSYRHIDVAVNHQTRDLAKLVARVSKVNLTVPPKVDLGREPRLPDRPGGRRVYQVIPHVAVTTAAALNAERSARKLKQALLKIRKEPMLNTTAAAAPIPPKVFATPHKQEAPLSPSFSSSLSGIKFEVSNTEIPNWSLPEDDFNPATPSPSTRRGAGGTKRHQSVALKRTPGNAPPPPTAFDWGPLPQFTTHPPVNNKMVPLVPSSTPLPTQPPVRTPPGFISLTSKSSSASLPVRTPPSFISLTKKS